MSFATFAQRRVLSSSSSILGRRSMVTVGDLSKRVKIASTDSNTNGTASLTLVLRAGSRYESAPGVANVLKNFSFKTNTDQSALVTVRTAEQLGGTLSATLTREHLLLSAEFLKGDEEVFLSLLSKSLFSTLSAHELAEDVIPQVALESNQIASDPATTAVETAHKLAFRSGLGNSLFASALEPVTLNAVRDLYKQARSSQVALIGTGIPFETLKTLAEPYFGDELDIKFEGTGGKAVEAPKALEKSKYFGGEERQAIDLHTLDVPGVAPTLVIAYGSTTPSTPNTYFENLVLANLLGSSTSPTIKRIPGSSPVATAIAGVEGSSASSFVATYSDASLLVVEVQAPGSERLSVVGAEVVKGLKGLKTVSKDQLKAAVAKAKFEVASKSETAAGLVELVVPQVFSGKVATLEESYKALDAITPESISKVLASFLKSKPTVVSIARLSQMKYAEELGL
ncbi:Metalloenzyme, LuxS/M16 peptidase-like protein [Mrakia frigida]|uniref:Metalloenzyme, LuxS/M16 peptidase-like protein n=1 Tax=Mrakia frigida TaxID=29902 RepID=UPI003FCC19E5